MLWYITYAYLSEIIIVYIYILHQVQVNCIVFCQLMLVPCYLRVFSQLSIDISLVLHAYMMYFVTVL